MMRILKYAGVAFALLLVGLFGYGAKGYWDALSDAEGLRARADAVIAQGRGGDSLGAAHRAILLAVEDPNFSTHSGVDFSTPGAGLTTITQSAAKRLAFEEFHPGIGKIRQTGYALGLERRLPRSRSLPCGWRRWKWAGGQMAGWSASIRQAQRSTGGLQPS
ncbi:transglycosylase domain-containing protein [Agrobacterium larrymoorei]|uniref:transglycosylase domain-containing protein n=1 Tax=Agrobacterium larrymoorei TaxID=160699 RepID=UPI001F19EA7F|nr:transglycosylase domain-containing protein [Agrobacterium larrymoorei]